MAAVQVHLTFNSVDEAIVALGRMVVAKAVPVVEKIVTPLAPVAAGRSPGRPRKNAGAVAQPVNAATSGNDAGRATADSRPADTGTTAPGKATEQVATPTATTPTLAPPQPSPAPAPAPTPDQVQAAVEKLFNAKGYEDCHATLSRFGVTRGKDLAPGQRADFIAKTERVIAGEAI